MGVVRIGSDGKITVLDPGTADDDAAAQAAAHRLITALARAAARRELQSRLQAPPG